jgi:hypothetical protein
MQPKEQSLDFSGQAFYIGLDIHKRKWVVTIRNSKQELKTYSMDPNPEKLVQYKEEFSRQALSILREPLMPRA